MTATKPAENVHGVRPNVCATCAYGCIEDGGFFCFRKNGFCCDAGDMTQWLMTCDRYKPDPQVVIVVTWKGGK